MAYTEEMTTSEILLRLASMRNELLQAVNDIEKISKNICYKAEQTEPKPCEWCNFYDGENCFSQVPCKVMLYFKTEPLDKDINVRSKDEPHTVSLTSAHISGDIYHKVKAEL